MTVVFRRLDADDWADFRQIRLRALTEAPQVYGTTLEQEDDKQDGFWRDRLEHPVNAVFAGYHGSDAVALAGLRLGAGGNVVHRGFIWGVFVAEEHRGRGVGRDLMSVLLDHADQQPGLEFCELNVIIDNAAAQRLYASLGFTVVGTIPKAIKHAGRYSDEHVMVRPSPQKI